MKKLLWVASAKHSTLPKPMQQLSSSRRGLCYLGQLGCTEDINTLDQEKKQRVQEYHARSTKYWQCFPLHNWAQVCSDPSTKPVTAAVRSPPSGMHRHILPPSKRNALLWAPRLLHLKFFAPSSIPRGHLQRRRSSVCKRQAAKGNGM